uniref:Ig-like domain-containing protein n=1 Tax=Erpetoichthys calabaricus TaxID=27687 RepID=A0A8C4TKW0_ERPCA
MIFFMSVLFSQDQKRAKIMRAPCISCFLAAALWVGCSSLSLTTPTSPIFRRVGDDVTLNFSLNPSNTGLLSVTWVINITNNVVTWTGGPVSYGPGYEGRADLNTMTGFLSVFRLTLRDSGQYGVSVITTGGESVSGSVTLQVLEPVSDVRIIPKPGQPIENKTFSLTCDASGQVESIHWVKNDQPLSPSGNITLSPDSKTLSFNPVLRSDNGDYKCTASNPASKMSSEVYTLTVNYGPEQVSISGSSDNVTVGAEVSLTCSAMSQPTAIFTWYLKGELIHKEAVYLIKSVKLNNAGNYTCEAFNSVTEERRSAKMELFVTGSDVTPNGDLSAGAIGGITIGVILSVAIIIALIVIYCCQDQIKAILGWKEVSNPLHVERPHCC